jgi:hypothetical protein
MDTSWICVTCGVQYPSSAAPPAGCLICEDERQYIGLKGQEWTTIDRLRVSHRLETALEEDDVWSIGAVPSFAIGQRAYLIRTPQGNLLWDCVPMIDGHIVEWVRQQGGIDAIAVSHPHYYSTMVEWSVAFGGCPVWIHEADRRWVVKGGDALALWRGERQPLFGDLQLVRCGGHFEGYQVLHWPRGCSGLGVLFAGDQPQVCMDRRWVTFMYSYPNFIPFDAATVNGITRILEPLPFDRLYGAFGRHLLQGARETIARSRLRYIAAIGATAVSHESSSNYR